MKKQRHYFDDIDPSRQGYGFSSSHVLMWELDHKEGWTPTNWCFQAQFSRRLLRVPWTARRSNQLILKEINPEYSLEGLMLKLKLQYFGYLMWRADSLEIRPWCWERLKAWGDGDDWGWDGWMASSTQWTWVWASPRSGWRTGKPGVLQSMGSKVRHNWMTKQPSKCHLNNLRSVFTRSRFHLKKLLSLFIHKKQLLIHESFALRLQQFSHLFRLHC